MAKFVLVINEVPMGGFEQITHVVAGTNGKLALITQPANGAGDKVKSEGTKHVVDNGKERYDGVRLEFDHSQVSAAAEVLKLFSGLAAKA
jgi:hypothetical protein